MRGTAASVLIGALAVTSAVTLSGCVHTTAGEAHRAGGTNPTSVADLESYLLAPDRVDKIVGSQDIEVSDSATTLDDNQSNISDPECLGALYNAEQSVYDGTGWTGVADQVLADQVDDEDAEQGHWVQQSVVEFGSAQQALDFFDRSVQKWTNCIGKHVTVNDADSEFVFSIEGIGVARLRMVAQAVAHLLPGARVGGFEQRLPPDHRHAAFGSHHEAVVGRVEGQPGHRVAEGILAFGELGQIGLDGDRSRFPGLPRQFPGNQVQEVLGEGNRHAAGGVLGVVEDGVRDAAGHGDGAPQAAKVA